MNPGTIKQMMVELPETATEAQVAAATQRLEALRPVPNPGGRAAIHTEARRLAALHARGLRVPAVLAVQDDALLLRHLGRGIQLIGRRCG